MNACPAIRLDGAGGMADALEAIDCQSAQASAAAFGRIFGEHGTLLPALTALLTLYIGFFAVQLLTGRASLGVSALTPRMLTLGLALTFATSWAAYQQTVWTLATQAPDELATVVAGTRGSATRAFAERLDGLFVDLSDAAQAASKPAAPTETGITPAQAQVGGFSGATIMWLSALMLLLGTAGVVVASKIALAALLALGPVFIVLSLFAGTRGLFEGWLKAVVMFAIAPLAAVLLGGAALQALTPVVNDLAMDGGEVSTRAVGALFLGASVYLALMGLAMKAAATIVGGWRIPGSRAGRRSAEFAAPASPTVAAALPRPAEVAAAGGLLDERVRRTVAALPAPAATDGVAAAPGEARVRLVAASVAPSVGAPAVAAAGDVRTRGIGTRFRERPANSRIGSAR